MTAVRRIKPRLRFLLQTSLFIFGVYGAAFFGGQYFNTIKVPVFNCVFNPDYLYEGTCYIFTQLIDWLASSYQLNPTGFAGSVLLVFGSTIIFILVFGRLLCGFLCPFGYLQDLLTKVREATGINRLKISMEARKVLNVVKWSFIILFFIGVGICDFCPVRGVLPVLTGNFAGVSLASLLALFFLTGAFFTPRFFCRVCPFGFMIGLGHKVSLPRLKKSDQACTGCMACYPACPMAIDEVYEKNGKEDITVNACVFCHECVDHCPEKDALKITWGPIPIYRSSRRNFLRNRK